MNAESLIAQAKNVLDSEDISGLIRMTVNSLMRHILATVREDDDEPINEETVRMLGGLPEGNNIEFGITIWQKGETEITWENLEPRSHILWNKSENSVWLETYDKGGNTIAAMELSISTRGQLRKLIETLKG